MKKLLQKMLLNWQLKLYMLLLAVLLWAFVVTNQVYETVLDVPVDVIAMKTSKVLVSDVPGTIPVRFSGIGRDLLILRYLQPARIELDIHTINYFYDYPIRAELISIPSGLVAEPIAIVGQDTVNIRLEDVLERLLPVIPKVTALPALGYMVEGKVRATPDSVTVFGPQSAVRRLRSVATDTVTFSNLERTTQESVPLSNLGPNIRITPATVRVTMPIDKIAERLLHRIPIEARGIPLGREVLMEPSTVDVILGGSASRLATMTADSVTAYLDLYKWDPEIRDYPVKVVLPKGLEFVKSEPERVRVRMQQLSTSGDDLNSEGIW